MIIPATNPWHKMWKDGAMIQVQILDIAPDHGIIFENDSTVPSINHCLVVDAEGEISIAFIIVANTHTLAYSKNNP